jgi:flagellar motor switch protein FliN/FliY
MSEDLVNNEETEKTSNDIEDDEISWDDVEAELEQQRDMIKEDAQKSSPAASNTPNLDFIMDIPLKVSVELGRTKLLINELLQLGQGSVIELSKLAGEPLEVLVNDKLIARGEAVVVNEKFGVRITDIMTPMERIEKLGE